VWILYPVIGIIHTAKNSLIVRRKIITMQINALGKNNVFFINNKKEITD